MILELAQKCSQIADVFPFLSESEVVFVSVQLMQVEQLERLNAQSEQSDQDTKNEWLQALGVNRE